jgi:hypothetical protein
MPCNGPGASPSLSHPGWLWPGEHGLEADLRLSDQSEAAFHIGVRRQAREDAPEEHHFELTAIGSSQGLKSFIKTPGPDIVSVSDVESLAAVGTLRSRTPIAVSVDQTLPRRASSATSHHVEAILIAAAKVRPDWWTNG